jgi:hypothetical protein
MLKIKISLKIFETATLDSWKVAFFIKSTVRLKIVSILSLILIHPGQRSILSLGCFVTSVAPGYWQIEVVLF